MEALETVAALYLLSHHHPKTLPDDVRLTRAFANGVLRLRPLTRLVGFAPSTGRMYKTARRPGAIATNALGQEIRQALIPFLVNLRMAVDAEHESQQQKARALRAPLVTPAVPQ
jgi:hypothetical protein